MTVNITVLYIYLFICYTEKGDVLVHKVLGSQFLNVRLDNIFFELLVLAWS